MVAVDRRIEEWASGQCWFCGRDRQRDPIRALVGYPESAPRICESCLGGCFDILSEHAGHPVVMVGLDEPGFEAHIAEVRDRLVGRSDDHSNDELRCSFCDRRRGDVVAMINGPRVLVCDGCVLTATTLAVRALTAGHGKIS